MTDALSTLPVAIASILVAAKLGGDAAERLKQPAVLGELLFGVALGNLELVGFGWFREVASDVTIQGLASLGAILLLFEVGLESTVDDMRRVGGRATLVATLGVIAPWILGVGVARLMLPDRGFEVGMFLGAALTATSVGITARVLRDLGRSQTREARIILGAAVIDDVMGLVILAAVTSMVRAADAGGSLSMGSLGFILLKAVGFLAAALWLGQALAPRLFHGASRLRGQGVLLATALAFCFGLAWTASSLGLAGIVGAYAAGLVLDRVHYQDFTNRGERHIEDLLKPLTQVLVPVFFVVMGMQVELRALAQPGIPALAALLIVAAVLGKQACSLGALRGRLDALSIGIGMIPRGEVGLIFASLGLTLTIGGKPVVDPSLYAALVAMVLVTTLLTPPLLAWSMRRHGPALPATSEFPADRGAS
ncbi:MAG: cation:proton antiporter [Gemmatimonadales bacterium]